LIRDDGILTSDTGIEVGFVGVKMSKSAIATIVIEANKIVPFSMFAIVEMSLKVYVGVQALSSGYFERHFCPGYIRSASFHLVLRMQEEMLVRALFADDAPSLHGDTIITVCTEYLLTKLAGA
jgi:hypothetical protein